jgi:hypothetical protein
MPEFCFWQKNVNLTKWVRLAGNKKQFQDQGKWLICLIYLFQNPIDRIWPCKKRVAGRKKAAFPS